MSVRQAAREFGLSRKTVRRMLQFSLPPGLRSGRSRWRARGWGRGWASSTRSWWTTRPSTEAAPRPSASGTGSRPETHAFGGGYTIVKDYVRQARQFTRKYSCPWRIRPETHKLDGLSVEAPGTGVRRWAAVASQSVCDTTRGGPRSIAETGDLNSSAAFWLLSYRASVLLADGVALYFKIGSGFLPGSTASAP